MNQLHHLDAAAIRAAEASTQRTADALRLLGRPPQRFDLCRAILHGANDTPTSLNGYESERDQELRRRHGHQFSARGFYVDGTDLAPLLGRADTVGTASAGGYLVQTTNESYIELARPLSVALSMGAVVLPNLVDNVNLPRVTAALTYGWTSSESTGTADSTHGFGQVALSPKEISVTLKISRQLALQKTPAASALIASDLMAGLATAIDVVALAGTGSAGQPTGITNTAGIGTVSGTSFNYASAIDMQGAVNKRLNLSGGYAAPITTAKLLSKRLRDATNVSNYVWEGGLYAGTVAGNRAMSSDNVPATTVIYGSWDQLLIGQWGAMQIEASPVGTSASDFQAGLIALRIICAIDVAVRDPAAFCVTSSTVT